MQLRIIDAQHTHSPEGLQLGMQASSDTENSLKNSMSMPAFQSEDAKNSLERLTKPEPASTAGAAVSNNQMMAQREGEEDVTGRKKRRADEIRYNSRQIRSFGKKSDQQDRIPSEDQTSAAVSAGSDALIQ